MHNDDDYEEDDDGDEVVELVTTHPKIPVSFQKSDLEYC